MSRLVRDWTVEPVSRDQILRRERGKGPIHFPCSSDHVQDWQPYSYLGCIPLLIGLPLSRSLLRSVLCVAFCLFLLFVFSVSC